MNKLWTKEMINKIKENRHMDYRELAKILQVIQLQLLDKIVKMRRNLEI